MANPCEESMHPPLLLGICAALLITRPVGDLGNSEKFVAECVISVWFLSAMIVVEIRKMLAALPKCFWILETELFLEEPSAHGIRARGVNFISVKRQLKRLQS